MGRWFGVEMGITDLVAPLLVRGASRPFDAILKNPCFTRLALGARKTFNWPKEAGVYVIRCKPEGPAIYVGMTGHVGKTGRLITKSGLNKRVYRWTPYFFDTKEGCFRHGPRCSSSKSKKEHLKSGYTSQIAFEDLLIDCLTIGVNDRVAPAAIEALLLQAHLDQYGCLPKANRQF
jgi:hypothetical protein